MAWIHRLAPLLILALSACDVRPVDPTNLNLAQIEISPMADRKGQIARLALQAAFDPRNLNLPPLYRLEAQVTTGTRVPLEEASNLQTAIETLTLSAQLFDSQDSQIWSGSVRQSALYARHQLPSLALQTQEALWTTLSQKAALSMADDLAKVLADT